MAKQIAETKKYKDSPLYSIYGARESKDGSRINITLITGKDDNKQYATISIKKDSDNLIMKKGVKGVVWVKVKLLKDKTTDTKPVDVDDNDLPF